MCVCVDPRPSREKKLVLVRCCKSSWCAARRETKNAAVAVACRRSAGTYSATRAAACPSVCLDAWYVDARELRFSQREHDREHVCGVYDYLMGPPPGYTGHRSLCAESRERDSATPTAPAPSADTELQSRTEIDETRCARDRECSNGSTPRPISPPITLPYTRTLVLSVVDDDARAEIEVSGLLWPLVCGPLPLASARSARD